LDWGYIFIDRRYLDLTLLPVKEAVRSNVQT
jgi:hypothetical protein